MTIRFERCHFFLQFAESCLHEFQALTKLICASSRVADRTPRIANKIRPALLRDHQPLLAQHAERVLHRLRGEPVLIG
jgi:hypothetical protein